MIRPRYASNRFFFFVKVQVSQTLACIITGNQDLQMIFWEVENFSYDIILELLRAQDGVTCIFIITNPTFNLKCYLVFYWHDEFFVLISLCYQSVRLEAGHALALFAYSNPKQQTAIRKMGGVPVQAFETFLTSDDESERAKAAFQVAGHPCLAFSQRRHWNRTTFWPNRFTNSAMLCYNAIIHSVTVRSGLNCIVNY